MRVGQLCVLVTAMHVAEQFDGRQLVTIGSDSFLEVGRRRIGYKYIKNERVDTDLAVVELTAAEADELARRFSFSIPEDVGDISPEERYVLYSLVGYPFSHNKPKPATLELIRARTTYIVTNRRALEPLSTYGEGKYERVHFALEVASVATNAHREPITLPKAQGMSGGGVWRIDVDQSTGQLSLPKLVGIGIEHNRQKGVFIATRIQYLLPLLKDLARSRELEPGA